MLLRAAVVHRLARPARPRIAAVQVIVFSQFWTHMMLIGRHLRSAGVRCAELRSHMKADEKARALHRFRSDPAVSAPRAPRRYMTITLDAASTMTLAQRPYCRRLSCHHLQDLGRVRVRGRGRVRFRGMVRVRVRIRARLRVKDVRIVS